MNRDEMIAIIEKGKDKMPGFEKELTKERIADLADYILFMKEKTTNSTFQVPVTLILILSGCGIAGITRNR